METKQKKQIRRSLFTILAILVPVYAAIVAINHFRTNYARLSSTDQRIISEMDAYCKANKEKAIWSGYELERTPVLLMNGRFGNAYLINPVDAPHSLFAAKINMPEDSSLKVYRISPLALQTWSMRLEPGDFNTIEKKYHLFGNEIYYLTYHGNKSLDTKYSTRHFITLLSHEAFHYYMQNNWPGGSRFSVELSDGDIKLIENEYEILADMQAELQKETPSKTLLDQYTRKYVAVMEQRIAANPAYLKAELFMETAEGTAQYIGIHASEIVGYDYGTMYFDNTKDVSFADVIPMLQSGGIDKSFLSDRMPYETGSLLCELMDELQLPDWQSQLNAQTKDAPLTLFDLLADYVM